MLHQSQQSTNHPKSKFGPHNSSLSFIVWPVVLLMVGCNMPTDVKTDTRQQQSSEASPTGDPKDLLMMSRTLDSAVASEQVLTFQMKAIAYESDQYIKTHREKADLETEIKALEDRQQYSGRERQRYASTYKRNYAVLVRVNDLHVPLLKDLIRKAEERTEAMHSTYPELSDSFEFKSLAKTLVVAKEKVKNFHFDFNLMSSSVAFRTPLPQYRAELLPGVAGYLASQFSQQSNVYNNDFSQWYRIEFIYPKEKLRLFSIPVQKVWIEAGSSNHIWWKGTRDPSDEFRIELRVTPLGLTGQ